VSTPDWDQSQIKYSRLGLNPKLVLQERTNSKTSTPEKDQFQNWYSREGPKCDLDLVTETGCDMCDISHPKKGIL